MTISSWKKTRQPVKLGYCSEITHVLLLYLNEKTYLIKQEGEHDSDDVDDDDDADNKYDDDDDDIENQLVEH